MVSAPKPPPPPDMTALADANRYAADMQYRAAQENRQMWEKQFTQVRSDTSPWRDAGSWAVNQQRQGMQSGRYLPVRWQGGVAQGGAPAPGTVPQQQQGGMMQGGQPIPHIPRVNVNIPKIPPVKFNQNSRG